MLRLWEQTRGGMTGLSLGHLPEAGGILDQHAATMMALRELSAAWHWLDERFPPKPKQRAGAR